MAISQFAHFYPGLYVNPAWPTRDKHVPAQVFFVLWRQIPALAAFQSYTTLIGTGIAVGLLLGGKKMKRAMTELLELAYSDDG